MRNAHNFEPVKDELIGRYKIYLGVLESLTFSDLRDVNKRLELIDMHYRMVMNSVEFSKFISDYHSVNAMF